MSDLFVFLVSLTTLLASETIPRTSCWLLMMSSACQKLFLKSRIEAKKENNRKLFFINIRCLKHGKHNKTENWRSQEWPHHQDWWQQACDPGRTVYTGSPETSRKLYWIMWNSNRSNLSRPRSTTLSGSRASTNTNNLEHKIFLHWRFI